MAAARARRAGAGASAGHFSAGLALAAETAGGEATGRSGFLVTVGDHAMLFRDRRPGVAITVRGSLLGEVCVCVSVGGGGG